MPRLSLFIALFALTACSSSGVKNGVISGATTSTSTASPSTASFAFTVDASATGLAIGGYVVGHYSDLKITALGAGIYGIQKIPAGSYDIIVNGTGTDKSKGLRLSGINVADGQPVNQGVLTLLDNATIRGIATVNGAPKAGIVVGIPNTPISATTDATGVFTIPNVPPGPESLKYSFSGVPDQIFAGITVGPLEVKSVPNVDMGGASGTTTGAATSTTTSTTTAGATGTGTSVASGIPGTLQGFTMAINGGALYSTSRTVTVTLTAPAGVTTYKLSEQSALPNAALAFTNSVQYTFQSDGLMKLFAVVSNGTQQSSVVQASITVDTVAPANGTVVTADGTDKTNIDKPTLNITSSLDARNMRLALTPAALAAAAWVPFASPYSSFSVNDGLGDGVKTVYFQFQDAAGNTSTATSVNITLATVGPAITSVTAPAALTKTPSISVTNITPSATALTTPTQVQYSCDGVTYASQAYAANITINLASGGGCPGADGVRSMRLRLVDGFGSPGPAFTIVPSITLDTTPPVAPAITVGSPPTATNLPTVTVAGTTEIGAAVLVIGSTNATNPAAVADGTGHFSIPLVGLRLNNANPLVVQATDAAGNSSSTNISVTHDNIAPVITPASIAVQLTSQTALVQWTTNEVATSTVNYGLTSAYGSTTSASPNTPVLNHGVTLVGLTGDTVYHYKIVTTDPAGNTTSTADATFTTYIDASSGIQSDTTWSETSTSYFISGNVVIDPGVTLTINPGVRVAADPGTSMQVEGTLIARGTTATRVTFTSISTAPAPGDWIGLFFPLNCTKTTLSSGNYTGGSLLENVDILYAGANGSAAVSGDQCDLAILSSNIKNSASAGIAWTPSFTGTSGTLTLRDSTVTNNGLDGLDLTYPSSYTSSVFYELTNNVIAHNGGWGTYSRSMGSGTISKNVFYKNNAGGLNVGDSASTLANNVVANNGVGFQFSFGDIGIAVTSLYSLTGMSIVNNVAPVGPAFKDASTVGSPQNINVTSSLVLGNSASTAGGGIISLSIGQTDPNLQTHYVGTLFNMSQSNIINNSATYNVTSQIPYTLIYGLQYVQNDWWGNSNNLTIQSKIYDHTNNVGVAQVSHSPFLSVPSTQAPISPPSGVSVTSNVTGQAELSWNVNGEADTAGYYVYYSVATGFPYNGTGATEGSSKIDTSLSAVNLMSCNVAVGVETCNLNGLTSGTTYYFAVTAHDSAAAPASFDGNANVNVATDVITATAHGYVAGQRGQFTTAGTLPTGLSAATEYFVVAPTTNTFKVSLTNGGAAVDITGAGSGTVTFTPDLINTAVPRGPLALTAATDVTPNTDSFAATAHGLIDKQKGRFSVTGTDVLPPGIVQGQDYFVRPTDANDFRVSLTRGGMLVSVPTSYTIQMPSISTANSTFTAPFHGMDNRTKVQVSSTGTLPNPLAPATDYFVLNRTDNTFQLALSVGTTNPITLLSVGTTATTVTPQIPKGVGALTFTPTEPSLASYDYQVLGHESWYSTEVSVSIK